MFHQLLTPIGGSLWLSFVLAKTFKHSILLTLLLDVLVVLQPYVLSSMIPK